MVQFSRHIDEALESLSGLLDHEYQCIVKMRYEELLHVVAEKKQAQAMLMKNMKQLMKGEESRIGGESRNLARQVEEKSARNEQMVRSSLQMLGEVLQLLYSHQVVAGQYDSKGHALAPCGDSTWHDSA